MNRKQNLFAMSCLAVALLVMSQFIASQSYAVQTVSGGDLSVPGGGPFEPTDPCLGLSGSALCVCQGKVWCNNIGICKPAGSSCYANPCAGLTGQALCSCQNKFWCSPTFSCVNSSVDCAAASIEDVSKLSSPYTYTYTNQVLRYHGCDGSGVTTQGGAAEAAYVEVSDTELNSAPYPHSNCSATPGPQIAWRGCMGTDPKVIKDSSLEPIPHVAGCRYSLPKDAVCVSYHGCDGNSMPVCHMYTLEDNSGPFPHSECSSNHSCYITWRGCNGTDEPTCFAEGATTNCPAGSRYGIVSTGIVSSQQGNNAAVNNAVSQTY